MPEGTIHKDHKAGSVAIVGAPNMGKSTLLNVLTGEKVAIVTPKAQTTRHRILGILDSDDYQIMLTDTPGIIEAPKYEMHEEMMKAVSIAATDADVLLYLTDTEEPLGLIDPYIEVAKKKQTPLLILINKIDLANQEKVEERVAELRGRYPHATAIVPISAQHKAGMNGVIQLITDLLPIHPKYYDRDQYTDRNERFLASEIIREKLFTQYHQELPYSSEVIIIQWKDEPDLLHIEAEVVVERDTQKGIIIGQGGKAIKRLGQAAREDIEDIYKKRVYLSLYIKVRKNWRKNKTFLMQFGYGES